MAHTSNHRTDGGVRILPSGRYQARISVDGRRETIGTFTTKKAAQRHLTAHLAAQDVGAFMSPERMRTTVGDYADLWLDNLRLKPKTIIGYEKFVRIHIKPTLGNVAFKDLDPLTVRTWYNRFPDNSTGPGAYAVLSILCNAAVRDEFLARNPCKIPRGSKWVSRERLVIGVAEVYDLADRAGDLHRGLVLLGAFGSVRISELLGLVRSDWNPESSELRIERQRLLYKAKGEAKATMHIGPPKSSAGVRTIVLPEQVVDELTQHIDDNVARDPGAVLFVGKRSRRPLHHGSWTEAFNRITAQARDAGVDIPEGFVFHDLRHTGNTLSAKTPGVTVADLQARLGDSTPEMALHYLHATEEARTALAEGLGAAIAASGAGRRSNVVRIDRGRA